MMRCLEEDKTTKMFKPDSKYRLVYLIGVVVVFTYQSVRSFYQFSIGEDKGMSLTGGIVFGVMAMVYGHDQYEFINNKKSINSGA